ncbi:MAG: hypothetical protein AAF467_28305 [Actinomycetota bacterium]
MEAAIVLLSQADLLRPLHSCITVDVEQNLAWMDWSAANAVADRLSEHDRAIVRVAVMLALDAARALDADERALRLAFQHILADVPNRADVRQA